MIFDDVLPAVVRVCESPTLSPALRTVAVVRDLRGRVRLAVDVADDPSIDPKATIAALRSDLTAALGPWFSGELLCTREGKVPLRNVAQKVIALAPPWVDASWDDAGTRQAGTAGRYRLLERRLGKLPWLEGAFPPPWTLATGAPTIVAFYSFKGGVGRTTTLASCALQAAKQGERVVVIDLDLEAPGVGSLLGARADRGVLDLLVEHVATERVDVGPACVPAAGVPDSRSDEIQVITAGSLGSGYLEKLARLDFSAAVVEDGAQVIPVREALVAVLKAVRAKFDPRWIFLDARAGLHDLAGLSLHGLSHVEVLFSRANAQGRAGLDLVLAALARRSRDASSRLVLVHALGPVNVGEARLERERMQGETHAMFLRHGLYEPGQAPAVSDDDADHRPWTIRRTESIERNDDIANILAELAAEDFVAVWDRVRVVTGAATGGPP